MLIVFFVLMLIILLMVFPFKVRFMSHFNILKMKGYYSIKILFIRLLCGMIYTANGKLYVSNLADAITPRYTSPFMKKFVREILSRVDVKKIEIFFTGGFAGDSFSSAILCGSITSAIQTFYSYLSQKYEKVKLYEDVSPTFDKDNLEFTCDIALSISIIQILIAIFASALKVKKAKENTLWKMILKIE